MEPTILKLGWTTYQDTVAASTRVTAEDTFYAGALAVMTAVAAASRHADPRVAAGVVRAIQVELDAYLVRQNRRLVES